MEKNDQFSCHKESKPASQVTSSDIPDVKKNLSSATIPFQCRTCPATFLWKHNRDNHEKTHNPKKPEVSGKAFHCKICLTDFTTEYKLKIHENKHLGSYECRQCDAKFSSAPTRLRHEKTHLIAQPLKCLKAMNDHQGENQSLAQKSSF